MRPAARSWRWRALLALTALAIMAAGIVLGVREFRPDWLPPDWLPGGDFALVDQDGRAFTRRDLQGRPALLYFGYTHCPDICPTTLFELSAVLAALGPDAARLQVVFATVDPRRDTPAAMRAYVQAFDPRIRALTGSPEAVAAMMHAYGARAEPRPYSAEAYTVDHSTAVLVLDAEARPVDTLNLARSPAELAEGLRRSVLADVTASRD